MSDPTSNDTPVVHLPSGANSPLSCTHHGCVRDDRCGQKDGMIQHCLFPVSFPSLSLPLWSSGKAFVVGAGVPGLKPRLSAFLPSAVLCSYSLSISSGAFLPSALPAHSPAFFCNSSTSTITRSQNVNPSFKNQAAVGGGRGWRGGGGGGRMSGPTSNDTPAVHLPSGAISPLSCPHHRCVHDDGCGQQDGMIQHCLFPVSFPPPFHCLF